MKMQELQRASSTLGPPAPTLGAFCESRLARRDSLVSQPRTTRCRCWGDTGAGAGAGADADADADAEETTQQVNAESPLSAEEKAKAELQALFGAPSKKP